MNRFWVFPLVLGSAGAFYGATCDAQGWLAHGFCLGTAMTPRDWAEVGDVWSVSAMAGFLLGAVMGLYAAWREMLRFRTHDRSGLQAAGRLLGNIWWIGIYALIANAATLALVWALLQAGVSSSTAFVVWFPAFFFSPFGAVNFAAILWAVTRTCATDDVLSPRVLLANLRRSARLED